MSDVWSPTLAVLPFDWPAVEDLALIGVVLSVIALIAVLSAFGLWRR